MQLPSAEKNVYAKREEILEFCILVLVSKIGIFKNFVIFAVEIIVCCIFSINFLGITILIFYHKLTEIVLVIKT